MTSDPTGHDAKTVYVVDYISIHSGKPRLTREYWRKPPVRGSRS